MTGTSGQLGKEQTLPRAEYPFLSLEQHVAHYKSMSLRGSCLIRADLLENTQAQHSSPCQLLSEAPGAYGILSHGHDVGTDSYETASTLASYLSPEIGMALRHISCEHHTRVSSHFQPLEGYFVSTGRSALRTGVPMHHYNRCFQDNRSTASRVWMGPGCIDI